MAVNAYLIIDGVPGPSKSRSDAIDILSFSFGATMTTTYQAGSSGMESKAGRADLGNLTVMKVLDKTSPVLFGNCVSATAMAKVTLFYDKPVGKKQEDYFKIELEDVLITSLQLSGSSENPTESVSFAFEKIVVAYNPEDNEGNLTAFLPKGYDLSTLKPF
jgi:type VI secretion system secreted protein Hcp